MRFLAWRIAAASAALAIACGQHGDNVSVSLGPTLVAPRGLLDNVQKLTVSVYEGAGCDASTGKATGTSGKTPIASKDLTTTGCQAPAKFCGELTISTSDATRVFAAVARGANDVELADGCAQLKVNQERQPLTIQMQRNVPPSVCGNGVVDATEQCDPPGGANDPVCDDQCHTKELRLSVGGATTDTVDGVSGDHFAPSFAWPSQSGTAGNFYAAWTEKTSTTRRQLATRFLTDSLGIDTSIPLGSYAFLIADTGTPPRPGQANSQSYPAVTFQNGKFFVAFEDDSSGNLDIHLRTINVANPTEGDQPRNMPIGVNGPNGGGEPTVEQLPAIAAGANGAVLVAWQSGATTGPGKIIARTYAGGTYGAQVELSSGTQNQGVRVAATSSGWVVAWQSGSDVKLRRVGSDGMPLAAEVTVNDGSHSGVQDHPGVATAGDSFAVVWADHGAANGTDIFVQRYKADGTALPGDQATRVNNVSGDGEQTVPAIAGNTAVGGMYATTWFDATTSHVRARLLGASGGFLFNNVDGQTNEFQASLVDGHARTSPTIAIGGSGPFIAIGWEDLDASSPGVYVRRFPVPTQ
jgi:hypothetical protein